GAQQPRDRIARDVEQPRGPRAPSRDLARSRFPEPPGGPSMTTAADLQSDPVAWDAFVEAAPTGAYPQVTAWAEVKAHNGWAAQRVVVDAGTGPLGVQLLTYRRRPVPLGIGYAPRGPVGAVGDRRAVAALTERLREVGRAQRLVEVSLDPEVGPDHALVDALRSAGWRPADSLQPDRSRIVDLTLPEDELWSAVRPKWRQYVSKARRAGVTVEDVGEDGLDAFYEVYVETARRAGFVVRAKRAYADVYHAFAARQRARLLIARSEDGTPAATLILLACGATVVEPYGGMTAAGAETRANYLLKWEAIRSSRERGFGRYDMWGIAHAGIDHFKTGFGGEEVDYAGTMKLVLDGPVVRLAGVARRAQVALARRSQGLPVAEDRGTRGGSAPDGRGGGHASAASAEPVAVTNEASTPPGDWDDTTVSVPGGSVLQGTIAAAHRAAEGWTPWYLGFADGRRALVLTHAQPPLPGVVAYGPRGPVAAGDAPEQVAARAAGLAAWARKRGVIVLGVDPELDADAGFEAAMAGAGFRPTEEIQPSRHRMLVPLTPGEEPDAVLARVAKQTRQRIRGAEKAGTVAVEDPTGEHLEAFAALHGATADRKGFAFDETRVVHWWRAALAAGHARLWVALHDDEVVGGLLVYRQGGHLATAYSADRADLRKSLPGTMHLLRWTVIKAAVEAGDDRVDLAGVDVRGARSKPSPGDALYGLYEHKASFGAVWTESAPAHEVILRPWVYRASLAGRALRRALRRRR
ncbi:MAG TPA: peptidoglycan bridge formation glycyltransferase FemA/FemB family protein, partial [Candidatus Limnocylindrales bacterium]